MTKQVLAATALLIAGALKFQSHLSRTPTLEDYLAFRCGSGEPGAVSANAGHFLASAGHCWGCYAMAIGAALLVVSAARALRLNARPREG